MITKEAKDKKKCVFQEFFFDSARTGFEYILKNLLSSDDDVILMPAYIGQSEREGSGVFDPVRHTLVNVLFYELDEHLQVKEEKLLEQLVSPSIKALLLIHYFGFPQRSIFRLKAICEQRNIVLIEDCAHSLQSSINGQQLGTIGDVALFSLHKLIATQNGGVVRINNERYASLLEQEAENITYEDLLQYSKTDISATSVLRIKNYHLYLDGLSNNSPFFDAMFPNLEDGVVPFSCSSKNKFMVSNMLVAMP